MSPIGDLTIPVSFIYSNTVLGYDAVEFRGLEALALRTPAELRKVLAMKWHACVGVSRRHKSGGRTHAGRKRLRQGYSRSLRCHVLFQLANDPPKRLSRYGNVEKDLQVCLTYEWGSPSCQWYMHGNPGFQGSLAGSLGSVPVHTCTRRLSAHAYARDPSRVPVLVCIKGSPLWTHGLYGEGVLHSSPIHGLEIYSQG